MITERVTLETGGLVSGARAGADAVRDTAAALKGVGDEARETAAKATEAADKMLGNWRRMGEGRRLAQAAALEAELSILRESASLGAKMESHKAELRLQEQSHKHGLDLDRDRSREAAQSELRIQEQTHQHGLTLDRDRAREAARAQEAAVEHQRAIERANAAGFAKYQIDRQKEAFRLVEADKRRDHEKELERIKIEARARERAIERAHDMRSASAPVAAGRSTNELDDLLSAVSQRGGITGQLASAAGGGGGGIAAAVAAVMALVGAVTWLASQLASLTVTGAQLAITSSTARAAAESSIALLVRSRREAERLYDVASRVGDKLGQAPQQTVESLNTLLARGFQAEGSTGAFAVIKAMADLRVISPKAQIDNIVTAIGQIKSKGKLALEELQGQLGEQFDVGAVISQLSRKLGKTSDEVRKLISAGKIDADTGILAFLDAIREKTGKGLGGAAEAAANTIPRLIDRIKGAGVALFDRVDVSPVSDFLQNIMAVLGGPAGVRLKFGIERLFGTLFKTLLGGFQGEEGAKRLERIVNGVADALVFVADNIGPLISALPVLTSMFADLAGWCNPVIDGVIRGAEALIALGVAVDRAYTSIKGSLDSAGISFSGQAQGIGMQIATGLATGVTAGAPGFLGALLGMIRTGIAASREELKVRSPSRVFHAIGAFVAQGLGLGIAGGAPGVERASASLSRATLAGFAAGPVANDVSTGIGASGAAVGGSGGGIVVHMPITVHVPAGSPEETREAAREGVSEALEQAQFERRLAVALRGLRGAA